MDFNKKSDLSLSKTSHFQSTGDCKIKSSGCQGEAGLSRMLSLSPTGNSSLQGLQGYTR